MLIEFRVKNFRSIKEQQVFSLAKSKSDEMFDTNCFQVEAANSFELLRSAAVYGANASGKSNLLQAVVAMRNTVMHSAASKQRGDELSVTPFLLDEETEQQPSEFEITFIKDEVRYQYGFAASKTRIHEEWLFAYPHGRAQRWFIRGWDKEKEKYEWDMGSNLQGEKQTWLKSTRDNALFLSTAVLLNSEQLQPLYDWFSETLLVVNLGGVNAGYSARLCNTGKKQEVLEFLKAADLGINDIKVEAKDFDPSDLPEEMPGVMREAITEEMKDKEFVEIQTVHETKSGKRVVFDFDEESDGTQKLFSFAGPWLDTLREGRVLFIDELHDNLHPKLVKYLVEIFHNPDLNKKNAQLIFTTHETSILNQDVFRRDQVWFCEKDKDQSTSLYPLTDFSPRKGRENLELAYLSGRYGAIPYIREYTHKGGRKRA